MSTDIIAHLRRLDSIMDALRESPLASSIRIFGSASSKRVPGDIDAFLEEPLDFPADKLEAVHRDILALAVKGGYRGNYGSFDPFLLSREGVLLTRNDGDSSYNVAWKKASRKSAEELVSAGRLGIPVLEFKRRFEDDWLAWRKDADAVLAEAADWYYDVCSLYEDEDLDPDDHLEVIKRAFRSSDCDDFAIVLAEMTGLEPVRASWMRDGFPCHHMLLRRSGERLLDVAGETNAFALRHHYRIEGDLSIINSAPIPQTLGDFEDDEGIDPNKQRIANVIRSLPWEPYIDGEIRQAIEKPLAGVDFPYEAAMTP